MEKYKIFETVIKCKWTMMLIETISFGIHRPGEIKRNVPGISGKVMYDRLKKLEQFGIIKREEQTGKPLKVYYYLTPFGHKLTEVINIIKNL